MTLGQKLQQLRKSKGMSQEELAEKLDVSRQSISKWELDDSIPDISKIILISDFFSVSTDYLLKESESENNNSEKKNIYAKVLFIASAFFISIGLICAIGGWDEKQNLDSIAGGMIINLIKGYPISPYPLNSMELLHFIASYGIVLVIGIAIIVSKKGNKSKGF